MASGFLGAASAAGRFALRQLEATTTRFVHSSAVTKVSVSKGPTSVLQVSGEKFLPSASSIGQLVGVAGVSKTPGAVLSCSNPGCTRNSASMAAHEAPESVNLSPATRIIPGLVHDVWDQDKCQPKYPKLTSNEEADVVIIGGGIAGLSVAYNLVHDGKKVVVLERATIGAGQTGRTTAHIMKWNDDFYHTIESKFGTPAATLVADSHKKSIEWMQRVVEKEKIDCDFQLVPGYLFGHDDDFMHKAGPSSSTKKTLDQELECAQRLGLTDTQKVHLGYEARRGNVGECLKFTDNGDFHPLKYLNGLARAITEKGAKIYEQTRVMSHDAHDVTTLEGHHVKARDAVVVATNSPIDHNLAIHARQSADRSYVVGLKIPKGTVEKAQWWDTAQPYHYVRTHPEGDYEVLIVGGEDHPTGQSRSKYYDAYGKLEEWARARFPMAQEVLYRWTGQVYEPADNLGFYGVEPFSGSSGDIYIATGDSGQGMTGGTIAGIVIGDLITGRKNPWAEVYSPQRLVKGLSSMQGLAEEMAQNIKGFGGLVVPSSLTSPENLPNDDGEVVQKGVHHVAVYKDSDGKVHQYSAICPHMKALVSWNPVDKTFDCPCHGSIFDRYGRCIQGPAKADLSPM